MGSEKQVRVTCQGADAVDVENLVPFQGNLKALSDQAFEKLKKSILRYGISFPVFVWKSGGKLLTIDGHQRDTVLRKMKAEGYHVPPVPVDYIEAGSKKEAREKILLLSSQYGKMSEESLLEFVGDSDIDLAEMGSILDLPQIDIDAMLEAMEPEPPDAPEAEMSRADELLERWQVKLGDVWEIGRHRLMCGDCTSGEDVERAVNKSKIVFCLTDPPYSVNYDKSQAERGGDVSAHSPYQEGDLDPTDILSFMNYVPCDVMVWTYPIDRHFFKLASAYKTYKWEFRKELVWVKNTFSFWPSANYQQKHEPIMVATRIGKPVGGYVPANATTVLEHDKPHAHKDHATARPVSLWRDLLKNHTAENDAVYDPFLGSGTTMVAAEQLGRVCYGMEISPVYCSVILERMTEMGIEAKRVE